MSSNIAAEAAAGEDPSPLPSSTEDGVGGGESRGSNDVLVQYVVLRRDLIDSGSLGSVITQGCHASVAAIWSNRDDHLTVDYCSARNLDSMHKVTLEVKGEHQILNLSEKLKEGGIVHKLWIEQSENIPTCLATKPYPKSAVSSFFRRLKLLIMATQPDGIGSSVDPSGKKKYGKSIRWTPDLSRRFMEYVAEEVRKGHKKNNTLDKQGWVHVRERFLNESSITLSNDQLRNHFDKTRRLWQGWRYLATHSELGWDQVNQTYTASDSFWEGFKKMYKDGLQLRWKGLSYEEEQYLQTIYGGSVATGEDRRNPSSRTVPPNEDERDHNLVEPLGNDDESTPNVEENILRNAEINNPPTMGQMITPIQLQWGTRSRASTPSSLSPPPTRRRRRSETSSIESSMSRACDIMEERTKLMKRALAPKSIEQAQLSSFEKSMQLLEALPSFNPLNPLYAWAPSFLCKKVKRLMFISISNTQLREAWLKTEFEKSTGSSGPAI